MARTIRLDNVWRVVVRDLRLDPACVLAGAGLPADLLHREAPTVATEEFFRLWEALCEEADDPDLGLWLGRSLSIEVFEPALFAALCSPNLSIAMERMSRYKRLMGPFLLDLKRSRHRTKITFRCRGWPELPFQLGVSELVLSVRLARSSTRSHVRPVEVTMPRLPRRITPYREFFGVRPRVGRHFGLSFAELDAKRPFLTSNDRMWDAFEPALNRELADVDAETTTRERVEAALLELLPSGRSQMGDAAAALGLSTRTLQRRLHGESTSFQDVLNGTRERLARHYLTSTELSGGEIAFLLGFEDPNSLFRAFHRWTGTTPQAVRASTGAR